MSAASPDFSDTEIAALKASIEKLGQLVPVVTYHGKILDGRKRLAACQSLGIEPLIVIIPDDVSGSDYAKALNLLRTHYTSSQRAMYAATVDGMVRGENLNKINDDQIRSSRKDIAKEFDILPNRISDARAIRREAAPEVAAAVEAGKIGLFTARKIIDRTPKAEQAAKVEAIIEAIKDGGKVREGIHSPKPFRNIASPKDPIVVVSKILDNLADGCVLLDQYRGAIDAISSNDRPVDWAGKAARVRKALRVF